MRNRVILVALFGLGLYRYVMSLGYHSVAGSANPNINCMKIKHRLYDFGTTGMLFIILDCLYYIVVQYFKKFGMAFGKKDCRSHGFNTIKMMKTTNFSKMLSTDEM